MISSRPGGSSWPCPPTASSAPSVITAASRPNVSRQRIQCIAAPAVTSAYGPPRGALSAAPTIHRRFAASPPGQRRPSSIIAAEMSTAST